MRRVLEHGDPLAHVDQKAQEEALAAYASLPALARTLVLPQRVQPVAREALLQQPQEERHQPREALRTHHLHVRTVEQLHQLPEVHRRKALPHRLAQHLHVPLRALRRRHVELLLHLLHAVCEALPAGLLRFARLRAAIVQLELRGVADGAGDEDGEEPAHVEGFAGLAGNAEDRFQRGFGAAGTDPSEEVADAKNSLGVAVGEKFGGTTDLGVRRGRGNDNANYTK